MTRPAPLHGIRVVDLTQVLAGPYCTYQLALLGAEVIKIEPPSGEFTRRGGDYQGLEEQGLGLSYCTQNADKQTVSLDLKAAGAIDAVLNLVRDADIFVQNYRPGVAERLGLGIDAVKAANPKIVYCSISAYGGEGPVGHRPAYDHVVQAMSGIMATTGTPETGRLKVGAPYIDYATGLNAAFAVMSALRERDRTGEAQTVDVAMLDTALTLMANNLVSTATTGVSPEPLGNEAASRSPSSGCFTCADGELLMLAANNERQFRDLCACVGHADVLDDVRWASPTERRENQDSLREVLAEAFATQPAAHWEWQLDAVGVPASRSRTLGELLDDGQPQARGLVSPMAIGEDEVSVQMVGIGFRLNGDALTPQRAPRPLGADNERWLPKSDT